jgi:hypothetical protein
MAPIEQSIAKQAMRAGNPLPNRIANAPELINGLQLYLVAFFDLDSERSHSTSLSPIPWTSIYQYSQAFNLDEEQTEDLFYFVKRLDSEHLKRLQT